MGVSRKRPSSASDDDNASPTGGRTRSQRRRSEADAAAAKAAEEAAAKAALEAHARHSLADYPDEAAKELAVKAFTTRHLADAKSRAFAVWWATTHLAKIKAEGDKLEERIYLPAHVDPPQLYFHVLHAVHTTRKPFVEEPWRKDWATLMAQCAICFAEPVTTPARGDGCGHVFCLACIHNWVVLQCKRSCPTCRAPIAELHVQSGGVLCVPPRAAEPNDEEAEAAEAAAGLRSLVDRFDALQELMARGVLTNDEYTIRRRELIALI